MPVLVTGATGHLGANVVRALLAQGRAVRAFAHGDTTAIEGLPVEVMRGDVLDRASLDAALDGVEVVYHLAAVVSIVPSDGPRLMQVNTEGPRNVALGCLAHRVRRLVHFSSVHALLPPGDGGVTDETRPPNLHPGAPAYDRSKAIGEGEVRKAVARGLDAVIVNPTGVLGPYAFHPQLHMRLLLDLYHGRLPSLVKGGFDWVDSRDVAAGALAAEARGRTGERYLLSGTWVSADDLAAAVQAHTGRRAPRISVPIWVARLGVPFAAAWAALTGTRPLYTGPSLRALHEHRRCANQKASEELGYAPRPFAETIADSFTFFEQVGLLQPGGRPAAALPLPADRLAHAADS